MRSRFPWVPRRPKCGLFVVHAERVLVRALLAEQHGARRRERARHGGVGVGHPVAVHLRAARRTDARRLHDVLEADRNAVERPRWSPRASACVHAPRVGERALRGDGHVGVQLRIQPFDAREVRLRELDRADPLPVERLGGFQDGEVGQVGPIAHAFEASARYTGKSVQRSFHTDDVFRTSKPAARTSSVARRFR